MSDWWLDEQTHAGAEHLDAAFVAGYDAKAQFDPSDDLAVLTELGMGSGSRVLDLAAGTGTFAFAAAASGAEVLAVDISPAMVSAMRRRAGEAGARNPSIVEAGFLSFDVGTAPFDFVYSRNALHQLPDLWKVVALRRIAGALKPGGVLRLRDLVLDVEPAAIDETVEAWMAFAVDDPSRGYTAAELAAHLRDEHSTFTWLLEPMLERAGFEIIDRDTRLSVYAAYICRLPPSS